jgi:DNA polymerase-3 subunit gamma/tau
VDSTWEGTADEEPPYDPEYDPAVPGFDPGDEPVDDAEGGTVVRESSEEQALRLLTEALGAERIGGTDQR